MKKNNMLMVASVTLFSTFLLSSEVFANTTDGTIGFKVNDSVPPVVDPENPDQPENPENPVEPDNGVTGNKGPLSLDVVPTKMDFGINDVDLNRHTYSSVLKEGTNHVLQVTDARDDTDGWSIKVSRTEFTQGANDKNPGATLKGSVLEFPEGKARNMMNESPNVPDDKFVTNSTNGFHTIPVGSSTTVIGTPAASKIGKMTSTYVWDASKEKLTIPANTAKQGNYSSTINWSLVSEAVN